MDEIQELDRQIQERLTAAQQQRNLHQDHLRQRMTETDARYLRFNTAADRIVQDIIRPRMELLAGRFDNAELEAPRSNSHHVTCRFHRTDRFPASTTLDLGVAHDVRIENGLATYSLEILPIFMKFEGKDQLAFPLDTVDEGQLAEWLDRKILQFVDTYLRLEQAEPYQRENVVTDPVCGMQIAKPLAAGRAEYQGQTYYFCVEDCRRKFSEEPARYAEASHS
jgi:YHS domain-containing protein